MERTRLKIIQHNVRHWQTNKHALTNVYLQEDGLIDNQLLKMQNYNIHQSNKDNEQYNGTAIAI